MPPKDNPQQQRNMLLFLLLSFALTSVYLTFFGPQPTEGGADAGTEVAAVVDAGAVPAPTPPTGEAPAPVAPAEVAAPAVPERTVTFTRREAIYRFDSKGGGLSSAMLTGEKMREQQRTSFTEGWSRFLGAEVKPPPQVNLALPAPNGPLPLAVSIEGAAPLAASASYVLEEQGDTGLLMRTQGGAWKVEKRVSWPTEGFELAYEVRVTNVSSGAQQGQLAFHWERSIDPEFEQAPSMLGSVGNQSRVSCHVADEQEVLLPGKEDVPKTFSGAVRYFGVDQQYFTSQLYFLEGAREGKCELEATTTLRRVKASFPLQLAPGATATFRLGGFVGPKIDDLLNAAPAPAVVSLAGMEAGQVSSPELGKLIDFGILVVLCKALLGILRFSHDLLGNWGLAIIALTLLVKILLFPLAYKQMLSAEQMKKLQPRMEAIRKKFADDKEKQQMETLKLYQEAKVNPLGGCLPVLLQMPVWFALFTTLRNSFDIYLEPFFGPVWNDLTFKDPTYVLPVLLGAHHDRDPEAPAAGHGCGAGADHELGDAGHVHVHDAQLSGRAHALHLHQQRRLHRAAVRSAHVPGAQVQGGGLTPAAGSRDARSLPEWPVTIRIRPRAAARPRGPRPPQRGPQARRRVERRPGARRRPHPGRDRPPPAP